MTWAQRLKRVFNIDISVCNQCGSRVKVIACIEDPDAISKILTALRNKEAAEEKQTVTTGLPNSRAPPQMDFLRRLNSFPTPFCKQIMTCRIPCAQVLTIAFETHNSIELTPAFSPHI